MKNTLYILLLSCFLVSSVEAQKKSKAEKAKAETEAYIEDIFGKDDKDFDIMKAPAKWADEPVVILCQKRYFNYRMYNVRGDYNIYFQKKIIIRRKLVIQDKSALEDYSEFYYQNDGLVGVQVIKPDGTRIELNFDDAVQVVKSVPTRYKNRYRSVVDYYKIAIPNLEVGDVIDYYTIYADLVSNYASDISTLTEEYPIVHQEIIFDIPKKWTFQHRSFNGAPEIVLSKQSGLSFKGKEKDVVKRYILEGNDRNAASNDRWDMPYLTEPTIKVLSRFRVYLEKKDVEGSALNINKLFTNYHTALMGRAKIYANKALSQFDKNELKNKSVDEKVNTLYTMLKYTNLIYELSLDNQKLVENGDVLPYAREYTNMREALFIFVFNRLLKKYEIERDYVAFVPKEYGVVKDAISQDEFSFGIYIPSTGRYYFAPNNYSVAGEDRFHINGASGYQWDASKISFWKKNYEMKEIKFPESEFHENVTDSKMKVDLMAGSTIDLTKTIEYSGVYTRMYKPIFLYNTSVAFDEVYAISKKNDKKRLDAFSGKKSAKKSDWRAKKSKKARAKEEEKIAEYEEERYEKIQNWVKEQYDIEEIKEFNIVDNGMSVDRNLIVEYSFESDEYVKKAGPNLIFDIGKLITSQVELKEEEINERKKPIELNFARAITNEIVVTIPEGKSVEGLEALNMNIDNESGAFISSATLSGNTLTVKTNKVYKQEFLPLEKWSELVEMLEAAYKFSQLKVVIK